MKLLFKTLSIFRFFTPPPTPNLILLLMNYNHNIYMVAMLKVSKKYPFCKKGDLVICYGIYMPHCSCTDTFFQLVNFSSQPSEFFLNIIFDDASQNCISPTHRTTHGWCNNFNEKGFGLRIYSEGIKSIQTFLGQVK